MNMFYMDAIDVEIMGGVFTIDVVTGYGLLCGFIFLTGFVVAMQVGKRRTVMENANQA